MSLLRTRRNALCAAALFLGVFKPFPALAEKLETGFTDEEVSAAFDKVLDDPFFERFTGLTIYDKASISNPRRWMGGTQSFRFVNSCVSKTVTKTPTESKTTSADGKWEITKKSVETKTETESSSNVRYLSYLPTLELTKKPGTVKLYCEAGEFGKGKDPGGKGVNPFALMGGLLTGIAKGISLGVMGGSSWSSTDCAWSPYDPNGYPRWLEKNWLSWRIRHFLPGGEDKLAIAFEAFSKKRYAEALPLFEEFGAHFGYVKNKVNKADREYKVWPFTYSSEMPEIFAILGDIYRLHVKDMAKAEEYYRIASSVSGSPYLSETAGIARANRGLGYTLAERARAAAVGPDKELYELLGQGAAFRLYAYLGAYKDREAPDRAEVMKLIKEVDPDEIREREQEAERQKKGEEGAKALKEQKEKVKALMEY